MADKWKSSEPPDVSVQLFRGPIVPSWEGAFHFHCGMKNLHNSCYLNATVQAHFHVASFLNLIKFISSMHRREGPACSNAKCVVCAFYSTSFLMSKNSRVDRTAVSDLLQVIDNKLSLHRQEDAAEFLFSALNTMAAQEIDSFPDKSKLSFCAKQTTGIHKLFGFWGKTTVTCLQCKSEFKNYTSHLNVIILRQHLWGLEEITSRACRYGQKHEGTARGAYVKRREDDPSVQVQTTGLHVHTEYWGLACSLDGRVLSDVSEPKTLEIKCPYTLRNHDPNNFESVLNKKQLKRFCLERNACGQLVLKEDHPYFYQIQMGMGMTDIKECDLFIWSQHGSILCTIPFNNSTWETIKSALIAFHWDYLVPEYFAMRTPRNLAPVTIP